MARWFVSLAIALAVAGPACAAGSVERLRLENGLTVLLRPVSGTTQIALVVLFGIGGDHDPKGASGLAHLIEHVYVTAAVGEGKARTIDEYVRRYPAGWNAQTGDGYTVIAAVFPKGSLDDELRDDAARMSDLRVTDADLAREKPRLLAEVANMFGGMPALAARNLARERIRPAPAGGRRGGVPDHVKAIGLEMIRERIAQYYRPRNAILVLAGGFDADPVRVKIRQHFGGLPAGEPAPAPLQPGEPRLGKIEEIAASSDPRLAGAEACIAFAAPAPGSEAYPRFLAAVARLTARASELGAGPGRWPVVYAVLDDPAVLFVSASAKLEETAEDAIARLDAFAAGALEARATLADATAAKNTFAWILGAGSLADPIVSRNVYGLAFSIGRISQLGIDPEAIQKGLEKVSAEDLRRMAATTFSKARRAGILVR
ncbi:MAG: insulinase family protein [Planctomycetes bacterium]|nr:insulinase family protein [Planctomycetota bacterium]